MRFLVAPLCGYLVSSLPNLFLMIDTRAYVIYGRHTTYELA